MGTGGSDFGDREHNEDAFFVGRRGAMIIGAVADGMGGAGMSGRPAADLAIRILREQFEDPDLSATDVPRRALEAANRAIFARSNAARNREPLSDVRWYGMGTTADVVLLDGHIAHIAHVGDSRVYRWRAGQLEQLTEDHSLENDYRRARPEVSQAELDEIPKNVITRALGMRADVVVDAFVVPIGPGDVFLLCTDGLTNVVSDKAISTVLSKQTSIERTCDALMELARSSSAPAKDNITVVMLGAKF
jgi:serine/threonine protein phosphatase PrpC